MGAGTNADARRLRGRVIHDAMIPIIEGVAAHKGMPVIDVNTPTAGLPGDFGDGVHPNDTGYALVAQVIHDGLLRPLQVDGGAAEAGPPDSGGAADATAADAFSGPVDAGLDSPTVGDETGTPPAADGGAGDAANGGSSGGSGGGGGGGGIAGGSGSGAAAGGSGAGTGQSSGCAVSGAGTSGSPAAPVAWLAVAALSLLAHCRRTRSSAVRLLGSTAPH